MSDVDFDQVATALSRATATTNAAECHGTLCGMYCVSGGGCEQSWVDQALADTAVRNAMVTECRDVLLLLFTQTRDALEGPDMAFEPLLPDDGSTLEFRAGCLGDWCQGFLYGMSLQGVSDIKSLPAEVSEVMTDFADITRAGFDLQDDLEESEQAYVDVTEFVRVGVQMVLECFSPTTTTQLH